jgi:hypothetical protein
MTYYILQMNPVLFYNSRWHKNINSMAKQVLQEAMVGRCANSDRCNSRKRRIGYYDRRRTVLCVLYFKNTGDAVFQEG